MAAVSNSSKLSSLAEVINSELISAMVNVAVNTPFLYRALARPISLSGASTRTYAHPIFPKLAAAAALTETDEVDSAEVTPSESTITAALVEQSTFLSKQARGASVVSAVELCVNRVIDSVMTKKDTDIVGLSASMTNAIGDASTTFNIANYNTVMTTFRAQAKSPGMSGLVLHTDAARDLNASAIASGAPFWSGRLGQALNESTMGSNQGFRQVTADGVAVFISDRIPVADSTGWGNFIFEMGPNNPLAIVTAQGGEEAVETWYEQKRQGWWITGVADYGVGILDQSRALECISKT